MRNNFPDVPSNDLRKSVLDALTNSSEKTLVPRRLPA